MEARVLIGGAAPAVVPGSADFWGGHDSELDTYGRFVGEWEFQTEYLHADGSIERDTGEWTFSWALEGRAVADVWTTPSRSERYWSGEGPRRLGMTVRVYDPISGSWNVGWSNAITGYSLFLVGREVGAEIVQEGRDAEGSLLRWIFYDIEQARSFRWRAECSRDDGASWRLEQMMIVRRKP